MRAAREFVRDYRMVVRELTTQGVEASIARSIASIARIGAHWVCGGGAMIAPSVTVSRTWFAQAWEVASDLVLATVSIWTLPLLLGAAAAIVRFLLKAM